MRNILKILVFILLPILTQGQDTIIPLQADSSKFMVSTDTAFYNSLLLEAAFDGKTDSVISALLKGANINTRTEEGVTPLMYAAQNGFIDLVELLIFNGANVNAKPNDGVTSLIAASRFNQSEIMNQLVLGGANVNAKDNDSISALTIAAAYNYYIPADLLLFYGADINTLTRDSITPLYIACYNGSMEVAELLISKGANVNAVDKKKWTPLIAATYNNNLEIVKLLLEKGAKINEVSAEGYTALAVATYKDYYPIAEYLLKSGANPEISVSGLSLNDLALYNDSYHTYDILKTAKVKKEWLPFFDHLQISASEFCLNNKDFLWGTSIGIRDKRNNISLGLGYNTRFWPNKILVEYGNNIFYQFRERRSIAYLSLVKSIAFYRLMDVERSVFIDLREAYTYGKYRASTSKPDEKFIFFPSAGLSFSNETVGFKIAIGYLKTNVLNENPIRISTSFYFKIPLLYYPPISKVINWL